MTVINDVLNEMKIGKTISGEDSMELEQAIKRGLDRNGILFLGSGFSYGGQNSNGELLKIGKDLSHEICRQIGIKETDDLTISSERYLSDPTCNKSLKEFIAFLSDEVRCTEVTEAQKVIASVPWQRIYTTNYDNAFEVASKCNGNIRISITIGNKRYVVGQNLDEAIIHINGSVLNLDENTFYDEFKITDSSYTRSGLLDSSWKELFDADLKRAGVIIFIGYSLQYDQELVRHIANLGIKDKCVFVDIDTISDDNEFKIQQYGTLYKIGTEGLAEQISAVRNVYVPREEKPHLEGFFRREKDQYYTEYQYTSADMIDLYVNGKLQIRYINQFGYCIHRNEKIIEVKELLQTNKIIVVESKLGNGKSVFLECLANRLVDEYDVYFVDNLDNMNEDLNYIFRCCDREVLLLIDDYGNYLPLLKNLGQSNVDNVKIVMTCRSSINGNLYYDLYEKYGFAEDEIGLISIDTLTDHDLTDLVKILNHNRVWGKYDTFNFSQKKKLLKKKYHAQVSNLFYLLLNSSEIKSQIEKILAEIKSKQGLFDFVLAQTINNICNLRFSYHDILEFTGLSDTLIRSYLAKKSSVKDVIIEGNQMFILNSSIYSQYLVKEANMHKDMLEMLARIFKKCSQNDDVTGKYFLQRRNMVSRSNILLLVRDESRKGEIDEKAILTYFDKIKNLPTATNNPFFWLQYGITAINLNMFALASTNFENAYANADQIEDFDTFQIDTHKARLLLCFEMNKNSTNKEEAMDVFSRAHELLYRCKDRGERLRYVLRQVEWYKQYFDYYKSIFDAENIAEYLKTAIGMLGKFEQYFKLIPKGKIAREVEKAYNSFFKLFEGTEYILQFERVNQLFNSKVGNSRREIRM